MKTLTEALEDLLLFAPTQQFQALTEASLDVENDEVLVMVESGPHEGVYKVDRVVLKKVED